MSPQTCFKCRKSLGKEAPKSYGLHVACFVDWFLLHEPKMFTGITRRHSISDSIVTHKAQQQKQNWNTSFFQGQFRKYSAQLADHFYILKIGEKYAPELPAVEYTCNQIAQTL